MPISQEHRQHAEDLIRFIDQSPTPWHAVETLASRLKSAGFTSLNEKDRWTLRPGQKAYVVRGDSSLIAFKMGITTPAEAGFRIIGAHTDSPGLRIKPLGIDQTEHLIRLGVEVYGSPILASYGDRDLSLAGRVTLKEGSRLISRLIRFEEPLLRLPNLAIHMNRRVNEDGLKYQLQTELPLLLGLSDTAHPEHVLTTLLSERLGVPKDHLLSFELQVYDTQIGAFWGAREEFLAHRQIDNLASCHASLSALLEPSEPAPTLVGAFFDHEEVGSQSYQGADGSFLSDLLERLTQSANNHPEDFRRSMARSLMLSADGAHGYHPNFPAAFEPQHHVRINEGPAFKVNVNQRYASNGVGEALFRHLLDIAEVPGQIYVHRTDLSCGSTIGPLAASRLGIPTFDCGPPMWAMHSIRESAGVLDQLWLKKLMAAFLNETPTN